jgi:heat shock protein 4
MEVDMEGDESPTDSVVMFDRGLSFPIVRRVTLRRDGDFGLKCLYDESALKFGLSSAEKIVDFSVKAARSGEKKVRINVKEDIHGIVHMSSAQMVEEVEEEPTEESKEGGENAEVKEGEGEGEKKKPKVRVTKTALDVISSRPLSFTQDEINRMYEEEVAMANNDRLIKETADMRNELESYIYDMRDKVGSDSRLGQYATSQEKDAFNALNDTTENWLYEDGFDATKKVYAEKLAELKKLGSPIERREIEAHARSSAVSALQANLETYQNWCNESQTEERYAHITDEERQNVRSTVDNITGWLYDMLDKQSGTALNQDPVLTVASIKAKQKELADTCSPIVHKPVPKKPEEEPKKDESKVEEEKTEEANTGDAAPMEGVEPEGEQSGEAMEVEAS